MRESEHNSASDLERRPRSCILLVSLILSLAATIEQAAIAQPDNCPNGGIPWGGCTWPNPIQNCGCGRDNNQCRPDPTGPAAWTDPTGSGSRTTQTRRGVRSPNSGWYSALPTGYVPGCNGSLMIPGAQPPGNPSTVNPSISIRKVGTRILVDYDAPNYFCKDTGDWPPDYTCFNTVERSSDRLSLYVNGQQTPQVQAWIYYDYGTWDTGIDVPCPGTGTYTAAITYHRQDGPVPPTSTTQAYTLVIPCSTHDRGPCPAGGGGAGPGSAVAKPINVGSGDVMTTLPLFSIGQPSLPLAFNLTYHASPLSYTTVSVPTPLGAGWTHPFNQVLKPIPSTNPQRLYQLAADGREFEYTSSGSVWVASLPAELRGTVSDSGTGKYLLTDLDGTVTAFDKATGHWISTTDRWLNSITGVYDGSGRLSTITDALGRVLTLTYSGSVLQQISIPESPSPILWKFSYDSGQTVLLGIQDPIHSGGATNWRSFGYDAGNRLLSMTDDAPNPKTLEGHTYYGDGRGKTSYSEGGTRNYVLVEYGTPITGQTRVTHRIDAATNEVSIFSLSYQGGRWLPTQIDGPCATCGGASGDTQSFTYYPDNHVATVTDGLGQVTSFVYDPATGNMTSRTDAQETGFARTTTRDYAYSAWPTFWTTKTEPSVVSGSKTTTRGWSGTSETTLTMTEIGHLVGGGSESHVTTQNFDPKHRLTSSVVAQTASVNSTTTYAYFPDALPAGSDTGRLHTVTDAVNLVTTYENYDVFGTATKVTDPNSVVTKLVTDPRGRVTTRTLLGNLNDPDSNEHADYVTQYTYDLRDRLTGVTLPRLNGLTYGYEDGTNRLTETIRRGGAGNQRERLLYTLNDIGGKIQEDAQVCSSPAPTCSPSAWTTNRSEKFTFDSKNRLSAIVHPLPLPADSILYTYDANGLLASVQDERHTSPNTIYAYDALNRLTSVTQTWSGHSAVVTSYAYDAHDNLRQVTDPNLNVTTYAYDDFRRLQTQTSRVSGTTSYQYDAAGNLTSTTDGNGVVTTRIYDPANRPSSAASARQAQYYPPPPSETVLYTYDDTTPGKYGRGRLATLTDPTGNVAFAYERRGLVKSESRTVSGFSFPQSYAYDGNGNRTLIKYPSTREVNYTFDFADRPMTASSGSTWYVASPGATYAPFGPETNLPFGNGTARTATFDLRYRPVTLTGPGGASYNYTSDALGNIQTISDAVNSRTFGYDDLNRLTSANTTGSALWGAGSFTYDALGNRMGMTLGGRNVAYAYEPVGGYTTSRLVTVTESSPLSVTHDPAGNETAFGAVNSSYSLRNYLVRTGPTEYQYDGRGLRLLEVLYDPNLPPWVYTPPLSWRFFFYTPEMNLLSETNLATWATQPTPHYDYIWFNGRPIAQETVGTPSALRYTMTDHLGTPFLQTDTGGIIVWRAEYEPFGRIYAMQTGSASDQPLRFPGQEERSTAPGTSYNIFRWYRPDLGQYTQADPLELTFVKRQIPGFPGTSNLPNPYGYAAANPLGVIDPLGLKDCGAFPERRNFAKCEMFCDAQKEWAECTLRDQLHWISVGGGLVAVVGGLGAFFESKNPVVGCLVGGGLFGASFGFHYLWDRYSEALISRRQKDCALQCGTEACGRPQSCSPRRGAS